jgi:hypothetical protein
MDAIALFLSGFLPMLVGLMIGKIIVNRLTNKTNSPKINYNTKDPKLCKPHKWITHEQGFMYCQECEFLAGSDNSKIEKEV